MFKFTILRNDLQRITFLALFSLITLSTFGQTYYLYVGTYTRATSKGIYVYQFNSATGDLTPVSVAKGITNPSFLAISRDQRFLYATCGNKGDSATAYAIEKSSHKLNFLNAVPLTGSFGAAHLETDKTGKWLIVGNYGSGSITVLPLKSNGSLDAVSQTIHMEGKSVHTQQDKPHVHSINIAPNNRDVFVPDLGTDKIMNYQLDDQSGLTPSESPFTAVTPGSGPRHLTFHPNGKFAYVIEELSATITAFAYKGGKLEEIQTVNTLADDYTGRKWTADIHISPDGKFLYGSNRAAESLAIFSIDPKSGKLTFVDRPSVMGKTPRNFAIDPTGNFLLVANQDSDNIVIFKRDMTTGKLTATGKEIAVSMPVCLKFVP